MSDHDKLPLPQQNPLTPKLAPRAEPRFPFMPPQQAAAPPPRSPFFSPLGLFQPPPFYDPAHTRPPQVLANAPRPLGPSVLSGGIFDWLGSFGSQPIAGTDQPAQSSPAISTPAVAVPAGSQTAAKPGNEAGKATLKNSETVSRSSAVRTNTATDKTELGPDGKLTNTKSTADRSQTTSGAAIERTNSDSRTVGYDKATNDISVGTSSSQKKTKTKSDGTSESSESSNSVQVNVDREGDGGGLSYSRYEKGEKDKGKTGQSGSVNVDLGDKTGAGSYSRSNNGVTNKGGIKVDKDGISEGSYSHSVENNGVTKSGGVKVNRDGVTVDGSYGKKDGYQVGGSATFGPDKTAVSASVGKGDNKVELSYTNVHGEVKQEAVTKDDGSVPADLLKGEGYLSTTRRDEVAYGGSVGVKNIGLSGDVRSGSALQMFSALPDNWDKLPKAEQDRHLKNQKDEQAKIDGLANVDLNTMKDGNGLRFTSYNGWNAGAGVSYGALSVNASGGRSSAHEVAIAKQDGQLSVSVARQDGMNSEAGLGVLGVGLKGKQDATDTHRFNFSVDPKNPEAMKSMQTFLATGLLPGADRGADDKSQVATQKFTAARGDVDRCNQQLAELTKREKEMRERAGPNPQSPEYTKLLAEKRALSGQMDRAQQSLSINRDFLNDQWETRNKPGSSPLPGVTVSTITDTHATTSGASLTTPLGNLELGRQERSWVHQQYMSSQSNLEDRYGFNEKNYGFFGGFQDEHATQTDTNTAGTVWAMYSNDDLKTNRDFVRQLGNKDVPEYALADPKFGISGRTFIELNQQQLSAMTTRLNDMNDPKSQQMWQTANTRINSFLTGKKWYEDFNSERDTGRKNEYADREINQGMQMSMSQSRNDFITQKQVAAMKGEQPWASIPDLKTGSQRGFMELEKTFATVKSPADFQNLDPVKQQLFVRLMTETSSGRLNPHGQSNGFESMAPASLIEDPQLRAQELRQTFVSTNEQTNNGNGSNGTGEFIKMIDRFKDDPATYDMLKKSVSFDWRQEGVEKLAGKSKEDLQKQLGDAYKEESGMLLWKHQDPNERKALDVLQAVNQQGGAKDVEEAIRTSGADPSRLLKELKNDPVRQHMYYDLLANTSYGAQLDKSELSFTP